jgi:hypothetical protein
MGAKHAYDRLTLQPFGKYLLPKLARGLVGNAAVHHCPAVTVFYQPQIDVVQCEWQWHA